MRQLRKTMKNHTNSRKGTKCKKRTKRRKQRGGNETKNPIIANDNNNIQIFESPALSCSSNTDSNYKEKGIVHYTNSEGINVFRDAGTGIFNFFGSKGFEGKIYETCKHNCLLGLQKQLNPNQKICNLKIDIETNNKNTIFAHGYGTLFQKI